MIWNGAPHCAFTDLTRYRGLWLCAFREGKRHALCRGKVRVLSSRDGIAWESTALFSSRRFDFRDPKFAPGPGGTLDIFMGATEIREGKSEGRHTEARRSVDGKTWTAAVTVGVEGDWLWQVERSGGMSYGVTYRLPERRRWTVHLLESQSGRSWAERAELAVPGLPNEATVRFLRGKSSACAKPRAIALVRREEGNGFAWIGTSEFPYGSWKWKETAERVGGPNFIELPDGRLVAATRLWRGDKPTVAVCAMTRSKLVPLAFLPSGDDCGYPGMVFHRGVLWISYYSSHEGSARIYLARVRP